MVDRVEIFEKALNGGGGHLVSQCQCGRTHYATDSFGDFDKGEREELEKNRDAQPDRYIAHGYDSVSSRRIFGATYIHDCPCGWETRISANLWNDRAIVMKFYAAMYAAISIEQENDKTAIQRATGGEVKPCTSL